VEVWVCVKIVCLYCGYYEADEKKLDSSRPAVYSIGAEVRQVCQIEQEKPVF
jgi:hypothetical protein